MGTYYLKYLLEEEGETMQTYGRMSTDKKSTWYDKTMDLYMTFIFTKGCNCHPPFPNMKKDLDKIYETHKKKDIYPHISSKIERR